MSLGKKRKVHGYGIQTNTNSQANPDSLGPDQVEAQSTCSKHISERLCKLEQLFEKVVCRKGSFIGTSIAIPQSPTFTSLCSGAKESKDSVLKVVTNGQSVSSLGSGIVSSFTFFYMSLSLKLAAWRPTLDFHTLHPCAGR